jgi:hypothetical protein
MAIVRTKRVISILKSFVPTKARITMFADEQSLNLVIEVATQHLKNKFRRVEVAEQADGLRVLGYQPPEADWWSVFIDFRAYSDPFSKAEGGCSAQADARLFCFHMRNWEIFRAVITQSPRVVGDILDEMELERIRQEESGLPPRTNI